jgi:lipid-A-disaccharide synthase
MSKILIIAGEASSDAHAASLVKNIHSIDKTISFSGLGGNEMEKAGVNIYHKITHLAFIGPGGLLKGYLKLRNIYKSLREKIKNKPPDYAILIDYAEFNLRVAKVLKKSGVPVIYYISPQIWAWGLWRIKTIRKLVDKMLVFFKFEEALYRSYGVDVKFIGHPIIEDAAADSEKAAFRSSLGIKAGIKIIGILPGSRKGEIKHILPCMLDSALLLSKKFGEKIHFVLPVASTIDQSAVEDAVSKSGLEITIVCDNTYNAVNICECAMVASGTATLETALLGVPMAIIYKTNFLTYILTKHLIKLPFIGLVNIVAGKKVVDEFLQYEARPEKIADYIERILYDENLAAEIKKDFLKIKDILGEPGASKRAAEEIIKFMKDYNSEPSPETFTSFRINSVEGRASR